jgi:hypothetical protein
MKTVRNIFACALLAVLIAAGVYGILFIRAATAVVAAVPGQISDTRAALTAEVQATRRDLMGQVAAARKDATGQLTALQGNVFSQVTETRAMLDRRTGDLLALSDRRLGDTLARADSALAEVHGLRSDLQPTLTNTAALTADAKDSWDDLYFDVKASVGSVTVAANQFGQASMDFRAAVPGAIKTWQSIGGNVDGITANVNRLTKPKWYDRLLGYGFTGAAIYRDLNPAANVVTGITRVMTTQH